MHRLGHLPHHRRPAAITGREQLEGGIEVGALHLGVERAGVAGRQTV